MNTILIEQNPLLHDTLVSYINQQPSLKLLAEFGSVLEAYHFIHNTHVDLIFANLDMAGSKMIDFSKGHNKTPLVIFTKSHQNAPFNTENAIIVDLLTDSLNINRFQKAIEKAQKWVEKDLKDDFIFIRTKNSYVKLLHDDIHYIKAMENFVQIVTRKETHTNLTPMKKILERLPPDKFVQVHRSYIVNVREVISIEKDSIKITLGEIPIGHSYKERIFKFLLNRKLISR
jgi:DNA-binding LytR/AlgR family response regulator